MDWFTDHAWQVWLGIAMVLGVAEMFSLDLVLLMLASGAIVGMVLGLAGIPVVIQGLGALAAAVAMLTFVRPTWVKRLHSGPELKQGHLALIGKAGFAVEEVSVRGGLVKVRGEVWTARPYDEHEVIPNGAKVEIFEIKGATAYVARVPELDS